VRGEEILVKTEQKEGITKAAVMEFGIISIMSLGKVSFKREKTKMK
jgi:hypothetical protein